MKKLMSRLKSAEHQPRDTQVVPLIEMTGYRPPPNDKIEGNCPNCQESLWIAVGGSTVCKQCGAAVRQEDLMRHHLGEGEDLPAEAGTPAEDYETLGYQPANEDPPPSKRGKELSQHPQTSPTDRTSEEEVGDLPLGVSEASLSERFRNKRAVAEVEIPGFGVIGAAPDPLSKGKLSWYFSGPAGSIHSYTYKGGGRAKMLYQLKNSAQVDPRAANSAIKTLDARLGELGLTESLDEGAGWTKEMGRLLSPSDARSTMREYEDNEENNNHVANYLLLAQIYGTTPEVNRVRSIQRSLDSSAMGLRSSDSKWLNRTIGPYYSLLRRDAGLRESTEEKSDSLWERLEDFKIKLLSKEGEDPPGRVKFPMFLPPREAEVLLNKWRRSAPIKGKGYDKVHFELVKGNRVISRARIDLQKDDPVDLLNWVRQKDAALGESLQESGSGAKVPFFPKYRWWVQKGTGSRPDKLVIWGPDGSVPQGAREEAILASGCSLTNPGVVDTLSGWQFLDHGRGKGMTISTPLVKESLEEAWGDYVDETKPHVEETSMKAGRRRFFVGYRDSGTGEWFAWDGSKFIPETDPEVEYYGNRVVAGKHLRKARKARPDLMGEAAPDPRKDPGRFAMHLKSQGTLLGYGKFKSPREKDDYYDLGGKIWRVHNRGVTNMTSQYGGPYGPQVWSPDQYDPKKMDWMQGKKDLQGQVLESSDPIQERVNPKVQSTSGSTYPADGPYVAYNGGPARFGGEKYWLYTVEADSKSAQKYLNPGGVVIKVPPGTPLPKEFEGRLPDLVKAVKGGISATYGRNLRGESQEISEVTIRDLSSGKFSLLYGPSEKSDVEKLLRAAGVSPDMISAGIPIYNPGDKDTVISALARGGYTDIVRESKELQEALTPKDRKVVAAFLDEKPGESKKLSTDGKSLDILSMGGRGVASWGSDGKIYFGDVGSKSSETVQRLIRKMAPPSWIMDSFRGLQELKKGQRYDPNRNRGGLTFWSDEAVEEHARERADKLLYELPREQDSEGYWTTSWVHGKNLRDKNQDRFFDKLYKQMLEFFAKQRRKEFEADPGAIYGGRTNRDANREAQKWAKGPSGRLQREDFGVKPKDYDMGQDVDHDTLKTLPEFLLSEWVETLDEKSGAAAEVKKLAKTVNKTWDRVKKLLPPSGAERTKALRQFQNVYDLLAALGQEMTESVEDLSEFGPPAGYAGARFAGVRRPGKGKMSGDAHKALAAELSPAELVLLWLKGHRKKSGWEDELRWKQITFPDTVMAAAEKSLLAKKLLKKAGRNTAITDDGRQVSSVAGVDLSDFKGKTISESAGTVSEDVPVLTQEMLSEARKLEERTLEVEYLGLVEEPSGKKGIAITIGGHQYHYAPTATNVPAAVARSTDGGVEKLAKKFKKVLALSPGRALAWLRKNAVAYAGTKKNPLGDHNRGHLLPDPGKKLKKSKEY